MDALRVEQECLTSVVKTNVQVVNGSVQKIPRPMNAFMLFAHDNRKLMQQQHPELSNKEISIRLGDAWKKLIDTDKKAYYKLAKQVEEDHRKKYPNYQYSPGVARQRKKLQKEEKDRMEAHLMAIAKGTPTTHCLSEFCTSPRAKTAEKGFTAHNSCGCSQINCQMPAVQTASLGMYRGMFPQTPMMMGSGSSPHMHMAAHMYGPGVPSMCHMGHHHHQIHHPHHVMMPPSTNMQHSNNFFTSPNSQGFTANRKIDSMPLAHANFIPKFESFLYKTGEKDGTSLNGCGNGAENQYNQFRPVMYVPYHGAWLGSGDYHADYKTTAEMTYNISDSDNYSQPPAKRFATECEVASISRSESQTSQSFPLVENGSLSYTNMSNASPTNINGADDSQTSTSPHYRLIEEDQSYASLSNDPSILPDNNLQKVPSDHNYMVSMANDLVSVPSFTSDGSSTAYSNASNDDSLTMLSAAVNNWQTYDGVTASSQGSASNLTATSSACSLSTCGSEDASICSPTITMVPSNSKMGGADTNNNSSPLKERNVDVVLQFDNNNNQGAGQISTEHIGYNSPMLMQVIRQTIGEPVDNHISSGTTEHALAEGNLTDQESTN